MWRGVSILAFCLTAFGATLERLSLEEMAARSTAIVRARAGSSTAVLVGSTIYTRTRFQVLERWKGPEGSEVEVVEPGGTVGRTTESYSGAPRFQAGQEMVLFLWTGPSGRTQVIGLSQGVFQVGRNEATGETEVSRQPSGEVMLDRLSGERVLEEPVRMPLRALEGRIRAAAERSRNR